MAGPIVRNYDKKLFKRCIKCRQWKCKVPHTDDKEVEHKQCFGPHEDNADGRQVICYTCKGIANTKARNKNVTARIRHHTGTRCLTQLGELVPDQFTANLESYLGYRISKLVRHLSADLKEREGPKRKLRDALNEGYHIDHKIPLSSYKVIVTHSHGEGLRDSAPMVDWDEFKACWAMENLQAIPADENLKKGAKVFDPREETDDGQAQTQGTEATKEEGGAVKIGIDASDSEDVKSPTVS